MNTFTILFLFALVFSYAIQFWLAMRQKSCVLSHREAVPKAFKDSITLAAHQKAADYTLAKTKLGDLDGVVGIGFLLLLTLGGGSNAVFNFWAASAWPPLVADLVSFATVFLLMTLVEIPTSLYATFVIEEKFGFNKSSLAQFFKDQAISLMLVAVIGAPVLALLIWVMDSIGSLWWLYAWAILMLISLLMSWLFPTLIAPLFNKFIPLEDGELNNRIQGLLSRCGFSSKGIYVMDGSKRSGHGNAYFTGFGSNKRIVFYDTLIDSLDDEELEAVLAHELGHFKCKHVIKMLLASSITALCSFAVLGWLITKEWFFSGLGVDTQSSAIALLLFVLVTPVFTVFMQPISTYFQRKFEFEADAFAAQNANPSKMISGLVKLYEENASTLTPDPLFCAFHYSHPPAAIRIAQLENKLQSA